MLLPRRVHPAPGSGRSSDLPTSPLRALAQLVALVLLASSGACALAPDLDVAGSDVEVEPGGVLGPTPGADEEHLLAVGEAVQALAALPVVPRRPVVPDYQRSAFGSSWSDVDGNGCNQRDDVLLRDAVPGSTTTAPQGRCPHDVLAGTWVDPYSGRTLVLDDLKDLSQAQAVQIDHVVPLAEAWRSGAHAWTAERRRAFANDLQVLLAVDGPTNAAKGDDDPAAWRPRAAYQCTYARRWVTVKHAWSLGVDDSERRALGEMLATCA